MDQAHPALGLGQTRDDHPTLGAREITECSRRELPHKTLSYCAFYTPTVIVIIMPGLRIDVAHTSVSFDLPALDAMIVVARMGTADLDQRVA